MIQIMQERILQHFAWKSQQKMKYQVFISYRRSTGENLAQLLYYRFTSDGYAVFFDVETMRSGKFNQQLYQKIEECEDFVLVLTKNALDRCVQSDDWVRLEIEYALQKKKNILLVLGRDFSFPNNLPDSIKGIKYYQGVTANSEFFDAVIKKLEDMFTSELQSANIGQKSDSDTSELMNLIESLYESTVSYRTAIKNAIQEDIVTASADMVDFLQKIYYICEREMYVSSKQQMIHNCMEILNQFNKYIPYYNAFVESTDRMSPEAQEYAECAEAEFAKFVDKICLALGRR